MSDTFTCQFCGEKLPSADTFHDLASCYAHLKVRIDSLEAENARLKKQLAWVRFVDELPEEGQKIEVCTRCRSGFSATIDVVVALPGDDNCFDLFHDYWRPVNLPQEVEG